MNERVKNIFLRINYLGILHRLLFFIFAFYISLTIVGFNILNENNISGNFQVVKSAFIILESFSLVGFSTYLVHYLNKKNILKLIWSYFIYLVVSYFILITRNINNPDFRILNLRKNHFFEYRGLVLITFVIILAFVLKYIVEKFYLQNYFDSFFQGYQRSESPLYYLTVFLVVSDSKLTLIFSEIISSTMLDDNASKFVGVLSINVFFTFVTFYFIVRFAYQAVNDIRSNKPSFSLAITTSLLLGLIFNYTLQLGLKTDGALMDMFVFPGATAYQIACITIINLLAYLIINRFVITTLIEILFWSAISIVNYIKQAMRNEPLLISDFSWIKDFKLLFGYIDIKVVFYFFIVIVIFCLFYIQFRKRLFSGKILSKKRYRCIGLGVIASVITFYSTIMLNEKNGIIVDNIPIISQLNNNYNVYWLGNSVHATYRSLLYVWTKGLTFPVMETPEDYSEEKIQELAKKYIEKAKEINATRSENISDQTVIYILSESLANPDRIPGVTLSDSVLPNIDAIKANTTSGLMKSDGYGGGTANMEFETLTSLPMYNLSSSITSLTTEIVPEMQYIPSISNCFNKEDRLAIHLGDAQTYSRINMYNRLGFDKFIAVDNGTEKAENVTMLGNFPSDASTYETLLENINTNANQFFSVITYQNHVPWTYSFDKVLSATSDSFSDEENNQLTNYANLLHETDKDTQELLENLSNIDKKIVVVFYGDHLPGLYPQSTFTSNNELQYQTDYFIWSNYPTKQLYYPYVNSSDLTAELLECTNSKVSPYYALLTEVLQFASIDKDNLDANGKKVSEDLKLIEYDLIQGKGYIKKYSNFFKIE